MINILQIWNICWLNCGWYNLLLKFTMTDTKKQVSSNSSLIQTRISNEKYLRNHPEIKLMLSKVTEAVLKDKPDDIVSFVSEWFCDPSLETKVLGEK